MPLFLLEAMHSSHKAPPSFRAEGELSAAQPSSERSIDKVYASGDLGIGRKQLQNLQGFSLEQPSADVVRAETRLEVHRLEGVLKLSQLLQEKEVARWRLIGDLSSDPTVMAARAVTTGVLPLQRALPPESGRLQNLAPIPLDDGVWLACCYRRLLAALISTVIVDQIRRQLPLRELDPLLRDGMFPGGLPRSSAVSYAQTEQAETCIPTGDGISRPRARPRSRSLFRTRVPECR
jgi:hypothetical protein